MGDEWPSQLRFNGRPDPRPWPWGLAVCRSCLTKQMVTTGTSSLWIHIPSEEVISIHVYNLLQHGTSKYLFLVPSEKVCAWIPSWFDVGCQHSREPLRVS